jgi:hypothetical protein
MFGIDEYDDDAPGDDAIPGRVHCGCGRVLDEPGGPAADLILAAACDGCAAAYRRWEAEEHRRWRAAGILDDDGNPTF